MKISASKKIVDTLLLAAIVCVTAYILDSALLKWLMEVGFALSLFELFSAAYWRSSHRRGIICGSEKNRNILLLCVGCVFLLSSALCLLFSFEWRYYILFFSVVVSADAGGLFIGKAFPSSHPKFSRNISPNKTYSGYFGEFAFAWIVGFMTAFILRIPVDDAVQTFILTGPFVSASGDLLASAAKRSLGIKNSSDIMKTIPVIGKLEWFIKSRDGYLDCFDSIASSFIYFTLISIIL